MNFEALLGRFQALFRTLSRRQLATLALTFAGVVGLVVVSAYWINTPEYRVLASDVDSETASRIVERLEADEVPYRLAAGGRTIEVPALQADRLRLEVAPLVDSGRVGWDIFDGTNFGWTDFIEDVNFRRALEGEIGQSIATLSQVARARVHISPAKRSLFGASQEPAKASVMLTLRSSEPLAPASVTGIRALVAGAVEGLAPEGVVVVDSSGRALTQVTEDEGAPLSNSQFERRQRFEQSLATRVVDLLEPAVGVGRVRAYVSATFAMASSEQTEERWDPTPVVRSEESLVDSGPGPIAGGVAGARANVPAPEGVTEEDAPTPVAAAGLVATRREERRNYEVGRVTRHEVMPGGRLDRLSVGVILDHAVRPAETGEGETARVERPWTDEELGQFEEVVASAVGLDPSRGDRLTIENIPFDEGPAEEVVPVGFLERYGDHLLELGKVVGIVSLGLMAFLLFVRPVVRHTLAALPPAGSDVPELPGQFPRTIQEIEGEIEAKLDAEAETRRDPKMPILTRRLQEMAGQQPQDAAKLMRAWLSEERSRR